MAPRASARTLGDTAFVLHRWDWSETSAIVDLFTREHGRVAVVAKGAKRPYSQLRAVLLPFQRLSVQWNASRTQAQGGNPAAAGEGGEIHLLKTAEWSGAALPLKGEPLLLGFYLNELLMKFLPRQDAHPVLFDAYARTLPALAGAADAVLADEAGGHAVHETPREAAWLASVARPQALQSAQQAAYPVEAALRAFELVLLREHGVLPVLDRITATQQPVQPGQRVTLRPEGGVCEAAPDEPGWTGEQSRLMEQALSSGALHALQDLCLLTLPELKTQARHLLHYHLGHQPLHTRRLMMDLQASELR